MTTWPDWFLSNWPWWVAFGWLIGYELFALATHRRTLSQMATRANRRYPPLRWIVIAIVIVLIAHFWFGLWEA